MDTIITVTVPAAVSIIGFIATYFLTKSNFKNELDKQKVSQNLEQMASVPYDVLKFFDKMVNNTKNKIGPNILVPEMQDLFAKIFAYGSATAITILSTMQNENYLSATDPSNVDKNRIIAFYILLVSQIKLDITGIAISPALWYQLRLNDYNQTKDKIVSANNKLVSELNLNKNFIISKD